MAIEGLSAYQTGIYAPHLEVSRVQRTGQSYQQTHGGSGTVEDTVTLSPAAQAILDYLSKDVTLTSTPSALSGGAGNLPVRNVELLLTSDETTPLGQARGSISNYIGIDLSGQNLSTGNFSGLALNYADLRGTDLSHAVLTGVSFANANVTGADFQGADLRGANFGGAVGLTADSLRGARVDGGTVLPTGVVLE